MQLIEQLHSVPILRSTVVLVTLLIFGNSAVLAGGYPPSDIDLRAAYCLPVVKMYANVFGQQMPNSTAGISKEELEFQRIQSDKALTNLNRVRSYLLAKINVDKNAMLIAMNRSEVDIASLDKCVEKKQCYSYFQMKEESEKCYAECNKETGGARERLKGCNELNWLPF